MPFKNRSALNTLIKNVSLNENTESKMIEILKTEFTEEELRWYVVNLLIYTNYHPTTDFPVNIETLVKLGLFIHKKNAKRTLENNFILDEDYKITKKTCDKKAAHRTAINTKNLSGTGLNVQTGTSPIKIGEEEVLLHREQNPKPLIKDKKEINSTNDGGRPEEEILLNIDTFKNICMLVKSDKSKQIRKYYVKLENIYNKIIKEEMENKDKLLEEQKELVKELENKPDTEGFDRKEGGTYCVKDNDKKGHYKIGVFEYDKNDSNNKRLSQLNVGSSTRSLETIFICKTFDKYFAEKIIHYALKPFRIKNEWFYFKNDLELAYAINTIKHCTNYINRYNIVDYNSFKNLNKNLIIENELKELEKEIQPENLKQDKKDILIKKQPYKKDLIHIKSEKYIGVFFLQEKNKWISKLNDIYLGIFDTELEAAKTYNDYALHINQNNKEFNYILNDISDYITTPRNVIDESYIHHNNISKYNGVSYNITRKYYQVGIKLNNKTYNLGNTPDEIEAAKIYNQQAAYFNESLDTKYILNDIPNYITIAKNIYKELQDTTKANKTSNYIGVSFTKQRNKWRAVYVLNKKQKTIGFFKTELEAAKEYNKIVIELNKDGCTYKVNTFDEEI